MTRLYKAIVLSAFTLSVPLSAVAQEAAKAAPKKEAKAKEKKEQKLNEKCPISGKAVNPDCTTKYEGKTWAFCSGQCKTTWTKARTDSLYQQLGGEPAIRAAVDLFYEKVLADETVNEFFEGVNMKRQAKKQRLFFAAALGAPEPWKGKDMRKAHEGMELTEAHFNAIATHLTASLKELKVDQKLIDQVIAVVATTKDDVLDREPAKAKKSESSKKK